MNDINIYLTIYILSFAIGILSILAFNTGALLLSLKKISLAIKLFITALTIQLISGLVYTSLPTILGTNLDINPLILNTAFVYFDTLIQKIANISQIIAFVIVIIGFGYGIKSYIQTTQKTVLSEEQTLFDMMVIKVIKNLEINKIAQLKSLAVVKSIAFPILALLLVSVSFVVHSSLLNLLIWL